MLYLGTVWTGTPFLLALSVSTLVTACISQTKYVHLLAPYSRDGEAPSNTRGPRVDRASAARRAGRRGPSTDRCHVMMMIDIMRDEQLA